MQQITVVKIVNRSLRWSKAIYLITYIRFSFAFSAPKNEDKVNSEKRIREFVSFGVRKKIWLLK